MNFARNFRIKEKYTFQIRKGIKFSNGQVMKPSDFLTTFERQFTVPGPTAFYSDIVGANKCSTKGCDLSKTGVVANDSAYTLTINLTAPDAELMDQLALPFAYAVPASTSSKHRRFRHCPRTAAQATRIRRSC